MHFYFCNKSPEAWWIVRESDTCSSVLEAENPYTLAIAIVESSLSVSHGSERNCGYHMDERET